MNFKDKKWNAYKKWEDKSYIFFDRIAKSLDPMIFRPTPNIIINGRIYLR